MKKSNKNKYVKGSVDDFDDTGGWIVGRFMGEKGKPLLEMGEVEVAWKKLPTSFDEGLHFHKIGTEINIVIAGRYWCEVNGSKVELSKGDFLVVYPETELANIKAEEGTELIVVKAPSVPNDKFEV